MDAISWWVAIAVLAVAVVTDLWSRRIPNWLVLPYFVAGVVFSIVTAGWAGLGKSLGGITLAVVVVGALCALRSMGLGDLKLFAAVGAWIGAEQMVFALIATAIVGGLMAVAYAAWRGVLAESLDGASDLVFGLRQRGFKPHPTLVLENRSRLKLPYAPAIAVGVIFSFFTSPA